MLAAGPLLEIATVSVIYGLGEFYKDQDHGTHMLSGIGFGLPHQAHFFMGLLIMTSATIIAATLDFYHTKAKPPGRINRWACMKSFAAVLKSR